MTNWSPYKTNPIDYLYKNLKTLNGEKIQISQDASFNFIVKVDGNAIETGDNLSTCYYLNQIEATIY